MAITTIPLDHFLLISLSLFVSFMIVCHFQIGLYFLVPLVLLEFQRFFIRTSHSLQGDFVGIYFPVLIVTSISWVLSKLAKYKRRTEKSILNMDLFVFLFLCWSSITLLWTPNLEHGFIQWVRFTGNLFLFYLIADVVHTEKTHKRIVDILIGMGLVISIAAFLSLTLYHIHELIFSRRLTQMISFDLTFFVFYKPYHPRAMGIIPHNGMAAITNLMIALSFIRMLADEKIWRKTIWFLLTVTMTFANLHSKSRGGLVGYVAMGIFFLVGVPPLRKRFLRNATIMAFIFATLFLIVYWDSFFGLASRVSAASAEMTIKDRFKWWRMGYRILTQDYAGIGMGIGGLKYYLNPLNVPHAHNIYLSVLYDFGVFGFAIFATFIVWLGKNLYNTMRRFQPTYIQFMLWGCTGGLVAVGIGGLVDAEYNIAVLWFYLGLTMATLRMAKMELENFQGENIYPRGLSLKYSHGPNQS